MRCVASRRRPLWVARILWTAAWPVLGGCFFGTSAPAAGPSRCEGPGLALCGGECVDLEADPRHCGACSEACAPEERCEGGACVPDDAPPLGPGPDGGLPDGAAPDVDPRGLAAAEGFVGFHGGGGYELSWTDRAEGEERYLLERRGPDEESFEPIAELPAGAEAHVDADGGPGSGYVYRLVAAAGAARGEPALCDSSVPLWTYVRIVDYDGLWGDDGPDLATLTLGHLSLGLELRGSDPNMSIVLLGDGYGAEGSIYAYVRAGSSDVERMAELDMGDPETYRDFFDWVVDRHPGQRYVVDFWGHGGGALAEALGYDDTSGGSGLLPDEMGAVLDHLAEASGRRIALFYLCTCLNGMLENAYAWRRSVDYLVAGETTVGCAYQPFEALDGNERVSPRQLATATVDGFRSAPADLAVDVVYAAIDLSRVDEVAAAVDSLADALLVLVGESRTWAGALLAAAGRAQRISYSYLDLYDLVLEISAAVDDAAVRAAAAEVTTLLEGELVVSFVRTDEDGEYPSAHGISIVHPTLSEPVYLGSYRGLSFARDTAWDDYLLELSR